MERENIFDDQDLPDVKKWEHSWTTDEIRRNSAHWTLAGDVGLFYFLNEFSHKLISRTHEMENEVDSLVHKTKIASVKINNVINDFHMLSNLQFVENRVYDEEVQDSVTQEKQVQEKPKEQRESEMLPKVIQAIELGLSVLDKAFDKINVDEISDSEDEEDLSSEGRTILEPKDPYEYRPLPYIIGSEEFQNDDFAGLRELGEEEIAEISAEDQTVSESESSSEEEEPLPLIDNSDSRFSGTDERMPAVSISDKLSSSDESELFGSEKDENELFSELSLDAKKNQVNQVLKSDQENIEKRELRQNSVSSIQSRLKLPQVLPSPKREESSKDGVNLFSNDDDISDDDSPFQKRTSLFKSEVNFANNDQNILSEDLFGEKVKVAEKTSPPLKFEKPTTEKEDKGPSATRNKKDTILFGTDDSEDDMFSSFTKPMSERKEKQEVSEKSEIAPKLATQIFPAKKTEKAFSFKGDGSNSLFGDDSDADDLFLGTQSSQKKFDFEATEDDDLFGMMNDDTPKVSKEKEKVLAPKSKKSEFSLFDESGSFDKPTEIEVKKQPTAAISVKGPKLFDDSDSSEQVTKDKNKSTSKAKKSDALFSDNDNDIFKQDSSKIEKVKPALLDQDDDFSLFDDSKASVMQKTAQNKVSLPVFEDSDNFDLFGQNSSLKKDIHTKKVVAQKEKNVDSPDTHIFDVPISVSTKIEKSSIFEASREIDPTEISFDTPVDISNTLNVLGKDRVKVSSKRRRPTRKGRLAALQNADSNPMHHEAEESIANPDKKQSTISEAITAIPIATSEKTKGTHKEAEKQKKDIMSQLMNEVAATNIRKIAMPKADSDDEVDLFSSKPRAKTSSQSDFSFLLPVENSLDTPKQSFEAEQDSENKSEASSIISVESADNEEFFTEPSFQGFRTSISHKSSVLDLEDDEDDDLFQSIQDSPLPKLTTSNAATNSNDLLSDETDDIFAGLQKEKYEMFPSQLYDDEDDDNDIFSSEKPKAAKIASQASSKLNGLASKKEPEKKQVNLFDDPLTGLLQE